GRIDVTLVGILLPLVARACVAAVRVDPAAHGWHRSAGAGLLLALVVGLVPALWPLAAALLVAVAAFPGPRPHRRRVGAALALLAVPLVVWTPWTWQVVTHPALAVRGLGLPEPLASRLPSPAAHLVALHPDGPGQTLWWFGVPLVLAALVGS